MSKIKGIDNQTDTTKGFALATPPNVPPPPPPEIVQPKPSKTPPVQPPASKPRK